MAPVSIAQKILAGVFVLLVVLTWAGMSIALEGTPQGKHYSTILEEQVKGLAPSSLVHYNGIAVGKVIKISNDFAYNRVKVEILITSPGAKIFADLKSGEETREGTRIFLVRSWVTGIQYLEMSGGGEGFPELPEGSVIPSRPSLFGMLIKHGVGIMENAEAITKNVEHLTSPENLQDFNRLLANLEKITANANERLFGEGADSVISRIDTILANFEKLTGDDSRQNLLKILGNLQEMTDPEKSGLKQWLLNVELQTSELLKTINLLAKDLQYLVGDSKNKHGVVAAIKQLNGILKENRKNLSHILRDVQKLSANASRQLSRLSGDAHSAIKNLDYLLYKELPRTNRELQKSLREFSALLKILKAKPNALLWGSEVKGQ